MRMDDDHGWGFAREESAGANTPRWEGGRAVPSGPVVLHDFPDATVSNQAFPTGAGLASSSTRKSPGLGHADRPSGDGSDSGA